MRIAFIQAKLEPGRVSGGSRYNQLLLSHLRDQGTTDVTSISISPDQPIDSQAWNQLQSFNPHVTIEDTLCHAPLASLPTAPWKRLALVHALGKLLGLQHQESEERRYLNSCHGLACVSAQLLDAAPLGPDHRFIWPPGRPPQPASTARSNHRTGVQLLVICNHEPNKGLGQFLSQLRRLGSQRCFDSLGLKVHLAGFIPHDHPLKAEAAQLQQQDLLTDHGQLSQTQLGSLYRNSDFLLVTSHYESYSLVADEAWAHGLPVLNQSTGGLHGRLKPGGNGFHLDHHDDAALITYLELPRRSPRHYSLLREGAAATFQSLPRWQDTTEAVVGDLSALLAQ